MAARRTPVLLAMFAAALALLAGCGSAQEQVGDTIRTYYERVAQGQFGEACDLFDPDLRKLAEQDGTPCATGLASQYDAAARAGITDITVDAGQVDVRGDQARVAKSAITFAGKASTDQDFDLIRRDQTWLINGGGG